MNENKFGKAGRWKRWLGEAALFLCIFLGVQLWQTRDVPRGSAPLFQGVLASGGEISLDAWRAQHAGQPVLLYFWADWCPICKTVAGSVDALSREHAVLTIAMQSGPPAQVARGLAEHQRDWSTVVDEDGRITARYGFKGVPAFVILDAAGNIRFVESGYTSEAGLRMRLWWAEHFSGSRL
jgi:thiol-disulfide isomerase/thioredoxin